MDTFTRRTAIAVQAAIEAAGQTQLGVAEESGIPRTTLIRRLRGLSAFTVAELEAIAAVLGTTVSNLLAAAEQADAEASA
ncbi:helix-turn-helix transcriptional regulator [Nocardioides sp. SR21]|uniref:helix-turn-helix domain-containing protein n=1 Tax=Nocardioides sp. SR21 TaxID=2919501 RepID=UPI001FA99328|nr:helix-turn-helix transcriptional regulator [Nocardioides sp. SR21]